MAKDLKNLCAYELGELIDSKKIDPIYVLRFYLETYSQSNKNIKLSFVKVLKERAEKEAEMAWKRQKEGRRKGLLDGIPIAWKDMIHLKGYPALAGSMLMSDKKNNHKVNDADIVVLAKKAGLISLAKTGTVEFAFGGIGTNKYFPLPTITKKNKDYVAGGSSTGSAVAVSNNLVPISIGTDTAGSVRIPAAWNNIVGFKPSYGEISTKGVVPLSKTYDTVGIFSKSVRDVQLSYNILVKKNYEYKNIKTNNVKALVVKDFIMEELSANNQEIYNKVLNNFSANRININFQYFPEFREANNFILKEGSIVNYDAWQYWNKKIEGKYPILDPNVFRRINLGMKITYERRLKIEKKIKNLKNSIYKKIFETDVIMLPTVSIEPPQVEFVENPNNYNMINNKILSNTRIANIFDMCAITLPIMKQKENWLSLSILAKTGMDEKLLRIAEKCESILN